VSADDWGKPERNAAGEPVCRWCKSIVRPPRRTFCGDACVHEWKLRSDPAYVRKEIWKRDRGTCRMCGCDLRKARRRWEVDHILPVADGGGECGLENYRLLCRRCHAAVTRQWRRLKVVVREALRRTASS
jgi:5-methylcytosine-specific restriction enzyme A